MPMLAPHEEPIQTAGAIPRLSISPAASSARAEGLYALGSSAGEPPYPGASGA
jgi:hypothetical protein